LVPLPAGGRRSEGQISIRPGLCQALAPACPARPRAGPAVSLWGRLAGRPRAPMRAAGRLYAAAVAGARRPGFYRLGGVPDTLDGRFELLVLHVYLVLSRLRSEADAGAIGPALFDAMFVDMDESLREIGVSDLSVGRRVKQMAEAFYGRVAAYDEGLAAADPERLEAALTRNLYGTLAEAPAALSAMATYLRATAAALATIPATRMRDGDVAFPASPFD
jgi:cytochrome b pre-mRNA-processing protein 3